MRRESSGKVFSCDHAQTCDQDRSLPSQLSCTSADLRRSKFLVLLSLQLN